MKLQLARKLLAIISLLLAIVILVGGVYGTWTDDQYEPAFEPAFLFAVYAVMAGLVASVSYVLWPK